MLNHKKVMNFEDFRNDPFSALADVVPQFRGGYVVDIVLPQCWEMSMEGTAEDSSDIQFMVDENEPEVVVVTHWSNGQRERIDRICVGLDASEMKADVRHQGGFAGNHFEPAEPKHVDIAIEGDAVLEYLTGKEIQGGFIIMDKDKKWVAVDNPAFIDHVLTFALESGFDKERWDFPPLIRIYKQPFNPDKEGITAREMATRTLLQTIKELRKANTAAYLQNPDRSGEILVRTIGEFHNYIQSVYQHKGKIQTGTLSVMLSPLKVLETPFACVTLKTNQTDIQLFLTPLVGLVVGVSNGELLIKTLYDLNKMTLEQCQQSTRLFGIADYFKICDLRSKRTLKDLVPQKK